MIISVEESRSSNALEKWLQQVSKIAPETVLREVGEEGTAKLRPATPRDSGITAGAWGFQVSKVGRGSELAFTNSSRGGATFSVVQGLRYGHGTGTGGYVPPNDFVSPIIEAIVEGRLDAFLRSVVK